MTNTGPSVKATGTIRTSRFVKLVDSFHGQECDANERPIGISMEGSNKAPLSDVVTTNNAALTGESFALYGEGDICLLEAGAAIDVSAENRLKSDGDGKGVTVATSGATQQEVGAIALQDAGADTEKIQVVVKIYSFYPALS